MSSTWAAVNAQLDRMLDDERDTKSYSTLLRIDAWNWAQDLLCHHTPREMVTSAQIRGDGREILLPQDFFRVHGLYDADNERWWWPVTFKPGDIREQGEDELEYWTWGDKLYLQSTLSTTADLELYYWAYWPKVEYRSADEITQDQIAIPRWTELAVMHLTAATCLMPSEIFASDINEYKIKVQAGTPLHNPRAQSMSYHLEWWHNILAMMPAVF
jgi:hypothetical protein